MKRIIAILLVIASLGVTILSGGCAIVTRGSEYCYRFLDYISTSSFDKAYEMLADSIKAPESEEEREDRLAEEEKEKEANRKVWREVFGLDKEEATPTPAADTPEPTPTPAEETPEPTPTPAAENGITPDPATGEFPVNDATPEPYGASQTTPEAQATPENMADESNIPADQLDNAMTPDPGSTPSPTPAPSDTPTPDTNATPDPNATPTPTPDPNATPTATPAATDDAATADELETTITKVEFIDRYQSIFDELELTGIDYTVNNVTDGEIIARVDYDLTYHSERAGMDLTYSFTIEANRIEHRWTINWSPSLIFPQMEWGDSLRVGVLQASRGEILCGGEAYAQNVNAITVFCVPSTIPDQETFIRAVAAVPEMEMTEDEIRSALTKQRNDFCKLKTFYPDEATMDLKTRLLAIDGIAIDTANYGTLRYYPYGDSLCHIIGYAGIISKKEKINYESYGDVRYDAVNDRFYTTDTRYNGDSYIGKYGLELLYEDELLGTNGRFTYIQTKDGGSRGMLYSTDAVDGEDLHLTIIPELQERLEDVVDTTVYDQSIHGCVIVINPKTGAIEAMTSWPGFDLNDLSRGIPIEEWEAMQNDPDIPLYNRATQGLYTPGSVFKLMTSAALLETNSMTLNDQFPASEEIVQQDKWFPSEAFLNNLAERASTDTWYDQSQDHFLVRTHSDSRPAPMNMTNSIISSDNLYFAYAAMRMGWTKFQAFMDSIGWNDAITLEATDTKPRIYWKAGSDGISWQNLAEGGETIWKQDEEGNWSEVPGVHLVLDKMLYGLDVSQPQLHNDRPDTQPLNDYDLAVTGYGQGEILMSPLQMACYASAYANDGVVMQPYLVDSIWHADGTDYSLVEQREPTEYRRILQQSTVDLLYPALLQVCVSGTARWLAKSFINKGPLTLGYTMAGKTGTAEINNDKSKELAWFICWRDNKGGVPVTEEDARLVCIMLEVNLPLGDEWSQMKMDIARALLKDDTLNDTEG